MTPETEVSYEHENPYTPIRASFSMQRGSREAVRWVAERYGVDQSDVVNLAPVLFVILAEASLNKRRMRLSQLETVVRQAERNVAGLSSLAPHLGVVAEGLAQALNAVLAGERRSIDQNQILDATEGVIGNSGPNGILSNLTYEVEDCSLKTEMTSPIIGSLLEMAKAAGITISQDTEGENGEPRLPFSMLFKLEGGNGGNLAVAAYRQMCLVTSATSMDEFLATRNEEGGQPSFLLPFTTLLG